MDRSRIKRLVSVLSAATVVSNGVQNSGASALSKPLISIIGLSFAVSVATPIGILVKKKLDEDKEEQKQRQKDKELKRKDEREKQWQKITRELDDNFKKIFDIKEQNKKKMMAFYDRIHGLIDTYPMLCGILLCLHSNDEDKLLKRAIDGYKGEKLGERGEHVVYDYVTTSNIRFLHDDWQQNAKEAIKDLKENFECYGDSFVVNKKADNCFAITFKNDIFSKIWVITYDDNDSNDYDDDRIVNVERPYSNTLSSFTFRLASEYQFGLDKKLQ
ncbi:MAG: hypothetical protein J6P21_00060 [Clostridia bacterium]|nr:hypothetical protein [Clostridia bacterium]